MHLAAEQSIKTIGDRLVTEIVHPAFAHVGSSAELGSKEEKGRLPVTNDEMALYAAQDWSADARLQPGAEPRSVGGGGSCFLIL